MSTKPIKSGNPTPKSGQYEVVGPRGGKTNAEITSTKGHPLPPTPKKGQAYVLVDPTKHKSGK
ncbi:hypothetical protein KTC96_24655 (plasmid) [Clostridium estertheticum]|uniref:hypothetical protein n=1 Tax=Clostridium estertheticum TaxID=238834 RepID=UPI001C7DF37F|nr:hypothetical protein [Clostridium estertheticum]MBX4259719.1 hypothetical protein [Clostridium estertheticum]WLC73306.1 hypothetical protein KTC96_24655 [Clostridium estertheticum]